jgi:low affinity Fe/Cu permease
MHHQASHAVSNLTTFLGSFTAIGAALVLIALWAVGLLVVRGGLFNVHYEMVVTTVTTMTTFVMVFIIQSTQNRESRALQTKLDALLIAKDGLDEVELLGLEDKPDATIKNVQAEVHDSEQRQVDERNRIVISTNVGVRPSEHVPDDRPSTTHP